MKLVKKLKEIDIYKEKVQVEMTVGELIMLRVMSGCTVSSNIKKRLEEIGGHHEFAQRIADENLNRELFENLKNILDEVTNYA